MKSLFQSTNGFSIVGVIVAAGMMGGLALYLANISKQQHVTQRQAETGTEITQLQHKILSVFYDGDSCTQTMVRSSSDNKLVNGRTLDELKNRKGTVVIKKGVPIKRLLQVEKMEIVNAEASGKTREAEIEVTIKKLGVANAGMTTVKTFSITAEMESVTSDVIARCHHTLDAKEHGIKTRMCTEMGGIMVCPNGSRPPCSGGANITTCSVDNLFRKFCEEMNGNYNPSSMKCDISDLYVDTGGDTMVGPLKGVKMLASGTDAGIPPCPSGYQDYACGTLPDRIFCDNGVAKKRAWEELGTQTVSGTTCHQCGWGTPAAVSGVQCP